MKQPTTHLKFIALFIVMGFLAISCQQDDTIAKETQSQEAKTPTVTTLSPNEAGATFDRLKNDLGIARYLKP